MEYSFTDTNYRDSLIDELYTLLPQCCEIDFTEVVKNNNTSYTGICIHEKGCMAMPVFRLESPCEVHQMAEDLASRYEQAKRETGFCNNLNVDGEYILQNVFCKLINFEMNREGLSHVPNFRLSDLAITFHCLLESNDDGIKSFRISNNHCESWKLRSDELLEFGLRNTPRLFPPVMVEIEKMILSSIKNPVCRNAWTKDSVLRPNSGCSPRSDAPALYIATNNHVINGASCLLDKDFTEQARSFFGGDYYVLPSSIHEILFLPVDKEERRTDLSEMVGEINGIHVPKEDILSDTVYLYSELREQLDALTTSQNH